MLGLLNTANQGDDLATFGAGDSLNGTFDGTPTDCDRTNAGVVFQLFVEGSAGRSTKGIGEHDDVGVIEGGGEA